MLGASIRHTECSVSPGSYGNSVVWQNTEKYEEGKFVANDVFPISSAGTSYLDKPLRSCTFYSTDRKKLRCCGHVDMAAKKECFSRVWKAVMEEKGTTRNMK
jgi:hypothetical protein